MRAKLLTLSFYVPPKFFHLARHTTVNLDTVSKCQQLLNTELKKSSRLDIKKEVLNHPILDGGVGLPCLQPKLFSLKIIDFFASDMSDQNSLLPTEFIFPKEFTKLLRNTNISVEISSSDFAIISNIINSRLIITIQTKSRDVNHFCLQNCSFHRAAISRLCFAANHYLCSEEELIKFTGKVWKNLMLDVWEKNFLYEFAYVNFKDQEKRWFLFNENAAECFYCNLECETFEQLIFSCPSQETYYRLTIGVMFWYQPKFQGLSMLLRLFGVHIQNLRRHGKSTCKHLCHGKYGR